VLRRRLAVCAGAGEQSQGVCAESVTSHSTRYMAEAPQQLPGFSLRVARLFYVVRQGWI
jgi:hypothetical protein